MKTSATLLALLLSAPVGSVYAQTETSSTADSVQSQPIDAETEVEDANAAVLVKPQARQGYYFGFGLRNGLSHIQSRTAGGLGRFNTFGFVLRAGQMANNWIGFGLTIQTLFGGNDTWGGGGGGLTVEVHLEPPIDEDLTIRLGSGVAGLGVSRREEFEAREDDPEGTFGALFNAGVSYDLFPFHEPEKYESGGFAFTGFVDFALIPGDGLWMFTGTIGLEVTWFFGLDDHKLDLPPDVAFDKDR